MKCLIAYFSRTGQNYVNGSVVDLKVGNSEKAAKMIQEITGGDMFFIDTVTTYPVDYTETTQVAKKEQERNIRPVLTDRVDLDGYDTVFVCYPNWWGTAPMAVFTFLEGSSFYGKTIIPLCTHEGSGMGRSEADIKLVCPDSLVEKGLAIRGADVDSSKKDIEKWIKEVYGN